MKIVFSDVKSNACKDLFIESSCLYDIMTKNIFEKKSKNR